MHVFLWVAGMSLLAAAAATGVIAWRMARGARVRESARIELLKALAFPDASAVSASGPSTSNWTPEFMSEEKPSKPAPQIFGERGNPLTTLPRWWILLFAVGAAIVVMVTLYVRAPAAPVTENAQAIAGPDRPIELIALQYRFEKATAVDVSGVVRNPAEGRELRQLVAVVNLLDANGRILTSQTTPLERPGLEAGQTSAFSLAFRGVTGTVASYQVGFRVPSGDTIPHVDRRAAELAAKTPSP